eukprot:CAMPEP_0177694864 /NCGR_PEP_ID=MMETSP0484_2-20121128/3156_1 /TAXON_ID=354590 /ORGANISM="Rhodomonas lens, Strain RHODO" /LENGTH=51 /DNA_ID=CAMNT_0019205761 /DNA_START=293 /DNA_END=445 /DNA_ORIENTATION=+
MIRVTRRELRLSLLHNSKAALCPKRQLDLPDDVDSASFLTIFPAPPEFTAV